MGNDGSKFLSLLDSFSTSIKENSISCYTDDQFRRRFRMRRHVFLRIVEALGNHDNYFQTRVDAVRRVGLSPLQKCTAAIRLLAYGVPADNVDDYVRIGESTTVECLERFVTGVYTIFGPQYLRRPNNEDTERLLRIGEARGFPGMLGSIDCMHWEWKNCPVAWKGQFCRGDHGKPTIMLEAVASYDLWIWHAFFGTPGSNNDINVLNTSNVFFDILEGEAPMVQYSVNSTSYNMGYYLADGIYPEWSTFVKTIPMPQGEKRKLFAKRQESVRKDVERAFGVLQSRFAIVRGPARSWHMNTMKHIMYACIIMHNMIVEDERDIHDGNFDYDHVDNDTPSAKVSHGPHPLFLETYMQRRAHMREKQIHHQLQADLVEHIWEHFRHENNEN
ncbi:putative nuclease HARBI1 [Trifolium pratense]|uniref:putative nuclease HARBI1 n=1 Tax=Trifolium pratense TaxID=57577 RepID=UPI001E691808|nr:putative nuclease HARBI1 [Trifolium pratense]